MPRDRARREWNDAMRDPLHTLRQREQDDMEFPLRRCAMPGCERMTRATLCEQHRLIPADDPER